KGRYPSCVARDSWTPSGEATRVRSTTTTPSPWSGALASAAARASVVLPMPPGPTRVTSRRSRRRSPTRASSASRPIGPIAAHRTTPPHVVTGDLTPPGRTDASKETTVTIDLAQRLTDATTGALELFTVHLGRELG